MHANVFLLYMPALFLVDNLRKKLGHANRYHPTRVDDLYYDNDMWVCSTSIQLIQLQV